MSLEEIVDLLDRHGRRATYGAVAAVLGHSPRSLLRGRERGRRFSWIVNRETGMPTGYSEELIDPRLKESGPVIVTDGELRTWLENPACGTCPVQRSEFETVGPVELDVTAEVTEDAEKQPTR